MGINKFTCTGQSSTRAVRQNPAIICPELNQPGDFKHTNDTVISRGLLFFNNTIRKPFSWPCDRLSASDLFVYLDGSKQVGFLPAEVEETSDGDPIRQEIDEGDVIDQVVRLSDTQDYDGGGALRENGAALKGHITEEG